MDKQAILDKDYMPYINKWGKLTNTVGVFFAFVPVIYFGVRYGWWPQPGPVFQGWLSISASAGILWIMQPIQFFPVLGVAGTYMSNLSGNISNMRVPCSIAAEQAAGVQPGTPEAEICANIGSAVSTLINILVLSAGVLAGSSLLAQLPPAASDALKSLLVPALIAACVVMVGWTEPRILPLAFLLAVLTRIFFTVCLPRLMSMADITSIFVAIFVCVALYKMKIYIRD
ncbi:MAG: hypothetical protein LBR61_03945 [Synergistaceae bacterium]|jgi:hypothetical protein|nr:hypothetical protein [Synergistaceae bacterium]